MIILLACLLTIRLHVVILRVRVKDLPEAASVGMGDPSAMLALGAVFVMWFVRRAQRPESIDR